MARNLNQQNGEDTVQYRLKAGIFEFEKTVKPTILGDSVPQRWGIPMKRDMVEGSMTLQLYKGKRLVGQHTTFDDGFLPAA